MTETLAEALALVDRCAETGLLRGNWNAFTGEMGAFLKTYAARPNAEAGIARAVCDALAQVLNEPGAFETYEGTIGAHEFGITGVIGRGYGVQRTGGDSVLLLRSLSEYDESLEPDDRSGLASYWELTVGGREYRCPRDD